MELYRYTYTHTQLYLAQVLLKYEIYYKENSRSALFFSYKKKNALIETKYMYLYAIQLKYEIPLNYNRVRPWRLYSLSEISDSDIFKYLPFSESP